jgi:hypothetical protein
MQSLPFNRVMQYNGIERDMIVEATKHTVQMTKNPTHSATRTYMYMFLSQVTM